jgi:RNA polymerase sigma-70 factor (ECF subfamily)
MNELQGSVEHAYRRYFAAIRAKCGRMLGDSGEAEDVAQETFIRLWHQRSAIAPDPRSVSAWIYRTATRLAIDRLRARRATVDEAPEETTSIDPEAVLGARRQLGRLARELPAGELEVAILSRIDGLSQREIAEVTRQSERSVRRVLARLDLSLGPLSEVS